jgi:hypothetical protein
MSDLQVINMEGLFTRDSQACGYIWSCNFKERFKAPETDESSREEQPSPGEDSSIEENEDPQLLNEPKSSKGNEYTPEEDKLIVQLKEVDMLPWSRIATYFRGRTQKALQVRYSIALKEKQQKSQQKTCIKSKNSQPKRVADRPLQNVKNPLSNRQYSLRQPRRSPCRYVPE